MLKLIGENAIVTGGSRGIGRAFSERFMDFGANVTILDTKVEEGQATAKELTEKYAAINGTKCYFAQVDVRSMASCDEAVKAAIGFMGSVEMINCNAGVDQPHDYLWDTPEEVSDLVFDVDVKGVYHMMKAVIPFWIENKIQGSIVNTASINYCMPTEGLSHYSAAKAAVASLTQSVACEAGPWGIRANAIAPGLTITDMTKRFAEDTADAFLIGTPLFWNHPTKQRFGTPKDLANVNVWLHSNYAEWVDGFTICVDGGANVRGLHSYMDEDEKVIARKQAAQA